ncbi:MAG: GxxExxY protein [Patescibacteria group bacterium]|jgi:GxxExxY protein
MVVTRVDLLYRDESFEIVGAAFEVFNQLGSGHRERTYQRALAEELKKRGKKFKEQFYIPVKYNGKIVGQNFFDFLVEDKIIVELKCEKYFSGAHIKQVLDYLVSGDLQLGILLNFTSEGVKQKRIVNIKK